MMLRAPTVTVFSSLLALQVALQAGRRKVHSSPVLFWAGRYGTSEETDQEIDEVDQETDWILADMMGPGLTAAVIISSFAFRLTFKFSS